MIFLLIGVIPIIILTARDIMEGNHKKNGYFKDQWLPGAGLFMVIGALAGLILSVAFGYKLSNTTYKHYKTTSVNHYVTPYNTEAYKVTVQGINGEFEFSADDVEVIDGDASILSVQKYTDCPLIRCTLPPTVTTGTNTGHYILTNRR